MNSFGLSPNDKIVNFMKRQILNTYFFFNFSILTTYQEKCIFSNIRDNIYFINSIPQKIVQLTLIWHQEYL